MSSPLAFRPAQLAVRLAILLAGGLLAWGVLVASWGGVFRSGAPDRALLMAPFDAGARGARGTQLLTQDQSPPTLATAQALATGALRRDATSVPALRTLGLVTAARGDVAGAARIFGAVEDRSFRDLPTQLWLLEARTQAGDVPGALRYYERTLDAIYDSWPLLFPIVAGASADPALAAPITDLLQRNRHKEWWSRLATTLVDNAPNPARAAPIVARVFDPRDPVQRADLARLLDRLGRAGEFSAALPIYRRLRGGTSATLGQRSFTEEFDAPEQFPPFEWRFAGEADLAAVAETAADGSGSVLRLTALNGRGGEVARRLLAMAPGRYRWSLAAGNVPAAAEDRARLTLACAEPAAAAPFASLTASAPQNTGDLAIPAGCRRQWLLVAAAGSGVEPTDTPWIDRIRILPIDR